MSRVSISVPIYFPVAHEDTDTTYLDERLDLAPLGKLLCAHTLRYLEGVTLDAGDDGVGVWPLLSALIKLLDDDDLVARLTALEDDRNLHPNQPKLTSRPTSQNS